MEKLKKEKHNHKLTDILKFSIFGIVMIAPFLSVLARVMYVSCNKNAKDSYSGVNGYQINYKYESNEVNDINDLIRGNIYTITLNEIPISIDRNLLGLSIYNMTSLEIFDITTTSSSNAQIVIEMRNTGITLRNTNYTAIAGVNLTSDDLPYSFQFVYYDLTSSEIPSYYTISQTDFNVFENVEIHNEGTLDNAFEYSINRLKEDNLYNWALNTGIYEGIEAMTTGLGMNNTIAMLLSYWGICTAVYIVFDIIIFCFVKLTHFMND